MKVNSVPFIQNEENLLPTVISGLWHAQMYTNTTHGMKSSDFRCKLFYEMLLSAFSESKFHILVDFLGICDTKLRKFPSEAKDFPTRKMEHCELKYPKSWNLRGMPQNLMK